MRRPVANWRSKHQAAWSTTDRAREYPYPLGAAALIVQERLVLVYRSEESDRVHYLHRRGLEKANSPTRILPTATKVSWRSIQF